MDRISCWIKARSYGYLLCVAGMYIVTWIAAATVSLETGIIRPAVCVGGILGMFTDIAAVESLPAHGYGSYIYPMLRYIGIYCCFTAASLTAPKYDRRTAAICIGTVIGMSLAEFFVALVVGGGYVNAFVIIVASVLTSCCHIANQPHIERLMRRGRW